MNLDRIGTIVRLELTQRVRSVAWYVLLGVFAVLLLWSRCCRSSPSRPSRQVVAGVYSVVIYFVLLLVVLVSPTLSGNAINGDRDAATLAPVQVTLATTGEIVFGKFLAAWITGLAFLAVAVPFIVATTVAGGVGIATMVISLLVLILETGIVAAIGVALSGILARPLFSVASTYLVVAALCVGTLIAFGLSGAVVRSEATSSYRSIEFDSQGNPVEPQAVRTVADRHLRDAALRLRVVDADTQPLRDPRRRDTRDVRPIRVPGRSVQPDQDGDAAWLSSRPTWSTLGRVRRATWKNDPPAPRAGLDEHGAELVRRPRAAARARRGTPLVGMGTHAHPRASASPRHPHRLSRRRRRAAASVPLVESIRRTKRCRRGWRRA